MRLWLLLLPWLVHVLLSWAAAAARAADRRSPAGAFVAVACTL